VKVKRKKANRNWVGVDLNAITPTNFYYVIVYVQSSSTTVVGTLRLAFRSTNDIVGSLFGIELQSQAQTLRFATCFENRSSGFERQSCCFEVKVTISTPTRALR
jgi:hypothetical protein